MSDIKFLIAKRLRQCRTEKQWTAEETAKSLNILPSRYSNWEQGLRAPKHSQILDLSKLFNKPAAWLAGFNELEEQAAETIQFVSVNPPTICVDDTRLTLECMSDNMAFNLNYIKQRGLNKNKLITILATDDSMASLINTGNELLIDQSKKTVKIADIFAILVNFQVWIRWIRPEIDNSFTITAEDSEHFPDIKLTREELSELKIIGRVARISKDR